MINWFRKGPDFSRASVKVYHGYGHTHNLVVYGHVFKRKANTWHRYTDSFFYNAFHLLRLFIVKPFPKVRVRLRWRDQQYETTTGEDGFFRFEWEASEDVKAGWHSLSVDLLDLAGNTVTTAEGKMYVPHVTQYAFISDIDDTIMISHSATMRRRLRELFIKNPRTRHMFPGVAEHYKILSGAFTTSDVPNPFFYVSSSEWNLYDYLLEFFNFNRLPQGAFLLNQIKRWTKLWRTGKTKHKGKFTRVVRILEAFPKQQFILFGDDTQADPEIYASIVEKLPGKIFAIYIRNIKPSHAISARTMLAKAEAAGVHTCLFRDSEEALAHSRKIGLVTE